MAKPKKKPVPEGQNEVAQSMKQTIQDSHETTREKVSGSSAHHNIFDIIHGALAHSVRRGQAVIPQYYRSQWDKFMADPAAKESFRAHFGRKLTFSSNGFDFGVKPNAFFHPEVKATWCETTSVAA